MPKISHFIVTVATLAATLLAPSAYASLVGQTLTHGCPQCGPPYSEAFVVTAGLGPELLPFDQWALDVEDTTVKITFLVYGSQMISKLDFTLSDITGGLASVSLDASSTFVPTGVTFSNTAIDFNLDGGRIANYGQFMLFNISQTAEIPEPTTIALVGLALSGVVAARRRAF